MGVAVAVTVRNMVGNALVSPSLTAVFVTTAAAKDVIRGAIAFAETAASLTLHKVPSGVTTVGVATEVGVFSLSALQTRIMTELLNQVFEAGDALHAQTSVTGAISLQIGGSRAT